MMSLAREGLWLQSERYLSWIRGRGEVRKNAIRAMRPRCESADTYRVKRSRSVRIDGAIVDVEHSLSLLKFCGENLFPIIHSHTSENLASG